MKNERTLIRKCFLFAWIISLSLVFCSHSFAAPADFSGDWDGTAFSDGGPSIPISVSAIVDRADEVVAHYSGTLDVLYTECGSFYDLPITGQVVGDNLSFESYAYCGLDGSDSDLYFEGVISGNSVSGYYSIYSDGEYYDGGSYFLTRQSVEITASASAGGTISPSGIVSLQLGGNQTFIINPNSGYTIFDVTVDGLSIGAVSSYTFTSVSSNHTITASFASNPQISTNPNVLTNFAESGSSASSQTLYIWNSGAGEINYDISTDVNWLTCTPDTGSSRGQQNSITVAYDIAGLADGVHSATITIAALEADNSPKTIPVTMAIGDKDPVYRFLNTPIGSVHFYTSSAAERDAVIDLYPDVFSLEQIAWYAHLSESDDPAAMPVYRFLNKVLGSVHFYTISEAERDAVIANYPDVFEYEGVAYYAYAEGDQPVDAMPVYRFLNKTLGSAHFYTISEAEKDAVIANYPDVFEYEGIAYYAFDVPAEN